MVSKCNERSETKRRQIIPTTQRRTWGVTKPTRSTPLGVDRVVAYGYSKATKRKARKPTKTAKTRKTANNLI
jgi:hypothetical protein